MIKKIFLSFVFCQIPVILLRGFRRIYPHILNSIVNMTNLRRIARTLTIITTFAFLLVFSNTSFSQDGKALFMQNCASCHAMDRQLTGPALAGATDRWPDEKELHAWIKNNQKVLASGYPYAVNLYNQYNKTAMNVFEGSLSDKDIDAIIQYIKTYKPPAAPGGGTETPGAVTTTSNNNTLLYGILTLILAIVAFVLLQVNANLKKLADDKEGVPAQEPVPFWRNKVYIMFFTLVV